MGRLIGIFLIVSVSTLVVSCDQDGVITHTAIENEAIIEQMITGGLTCDAQLQITSLSETDLLDFAHRFQETVTEEDRMAIVENRERDCVTEATEDSSVASTTQAITGVYADIFIPEVSTGGVYGSSVFRDSAASSWKCNGGAAESPADYIMQFHLQGAYYSRAQLKLQGQNIWGNCYLNNNSAARVFSDDDVRSCIGYWTVIACGGTPPLTTDIKLGL